MNKTVELGWINERIQLVAFDGQFIEGRISCQAGDSCEGFDLSGQLRLNY